MIAKYKAFLISPQFILVILKFPYAKALALVQNCGSLETTQALEFINYLTLVWLKVRVKILPCFSAWCIV
jgi:hypothetical protein